VLGFFLRSNESVEALPPTTNALIRHLKRLLWMAIDDYRDGHLGGHDVQRTGSGTRNVRN
jgi:hypothetical protein